MTLKHWWKSGAAALISLAFSALAFAQTDPSGTASTTTTSTTTGVSWYGHWYIWVGLAVFLIVVIALTNRGGSRSS